MFMKKPSHKVFDYVPRHYDPLKDEEERHKRRLKFESQRNIRRKTKSPLIWIILALMIIYLLIKFGNGVL